MKTRMLVSILIFVLAVLIIAGSCATGKKAYVATEDEEIYGIWVNEDYNTSGKHSAKLNYNPDGSWVAYTLLSIDFAGYHGEFSIIDKWNDSKGNIWYKVNESWSLWRYPRYYLVKINNSGKISEWFYGIHDYLNEINPKHPHYRIYYRQ